MLLYHASLHNGQKLLKPELKLKLKLPCLKLFGTDIWLQQQKKFTLIKCVCNVYVCVCVSTCVIQHVCKSQTAIFWSWFSPSDTWALGSNSGYQVCTATAFLYWGVFPVLGNSSETYFFFFFYFFLPLLLFFCFSSLPFPLNLPLLLLLHVCVFSMHMAQNLW